jgi:hypothetical protein
VFVRGNERSQRFRPDVLWRKTLAFHPLPHTIVAFDMIGSGRLNDNLLLGVRADMRMIAGATFAQQGIDVASLETQDLGDGLRFVVPGLITPPSLLDPFIPNLDTALAQHRERSSAEARLRLRVAVHHGLVHSDGGVAAGEPLRIAARLLDAEPVRRAATLAPEANLVLVVSRELYESVVRHGYGLSPDLYQPVAVREKETVGVAWLYVPRYTPGLALDAPDEGGPAADPPAGTEPSTNGVARPGPASRSTSVDVTATTATFSGPVVGGDFHAR